MVRPRGKVSLRRIENPRSRRSTFANRIKGLKNKLHELTTLCDVKACFICYGHDGELVTWPQDDAKIRELIKKDRALGDKRREMTMANIYHDRMRKLERELAQTRRKNAEFLYPSWNTQLDQLNSDGFRDLGKFLQDKLEKVRQRIEWLKIKEADDLKSFTHQMVHNFLDHQSGNFDYYQPTPIQGLPKLPETMPTFGFQPCMSNQFSHSQYIIPNNTVYSTGETDNPMRMPQGFMPTYRFQPQMPAVQDQAFSVDPDSAQDLDYMINGLFPSNW